MSTRGAAAADAIAPVNGNPERTFPTELLLFSFHSFRIFKRLHIFYIPAIAQSMKGVRGWTLVAVED
jgi:hypothetical protein